MKTKILFLAANPEALTTLDLEGELRNLELELAAVQFRDRISLVAKHAVHADDLVRHVRGERPTIVHFSGHGMTQGIVVRHDKHGHQPISGDSLRRFFANRGVVLVVLNSCASQPQIEAMSDSVPMIIGTSGALDDEAARRFTAAFYRTLGNGNTVAEAFRDGKDTVDLHGKEDVFVSCGDLAQPLCFDAPADPQ
jgi:CHAT domain-containing protein